MEELKRKEPDKKELRRIFEQLEFRTLIERVLNEEKKAAPSPAPQPDLFGFFTDEKTGEAKNSDNDILKP